MHIPRIFYLGKLNSESVASLSLAASHHLLNVLRLKLNAEVVLFNGDGKDYFGHIIDCSKKILTIKIDQVENNNTESALKVHLLQAVSKGERMDFTLQKAVELGVHRISPVITEYCQVKLDHARQLKKHAHWQSVVISACEQSGRAVIPKLDFLQTYLKCISNRGSQLKLICHPELVSQPLKRLASPQTISLLIGPEGGFSEQEVALARQNNFIPLNLGPRILRTETAALAAITVLQALWGDISLD